MIPMEGRLETLGMESNEEDMFECADENFHMEKPQLLIGTVKPSTGDSNAKQGRINGTRSSTFVHHVRRAQAPPMLVDKAESSKK